MPASLPPWRSPLEVMITQPPTRRSRLPGQLLAALPGSPLHAPATEFLFARTWCCDKSWVLSPRGTCLPGRGGTQSQFDTLPLETGKIKFLLRCFIPFRLACWRRGFYTLFSLSQLFTSECLYLNHFLVLSFFK